MTSLELLDSKRFCMFMTQLASQWDLQTDIEKEKVLDELTGWLGTGKPVSITATSFTSQLGHGERPTVAIALAPPPKRKGGRPKGSKNAPKPETETDKAALKHEHTRPLTEAERKEVLAQLAKEPPARDPQLIVNDAVAEVIKPNWNATPVNEGYRHFIVNADRKGERVSFELDKWKSALSSNGLPSGSVVFKPEGLGMSQGSLETGRSGNKWRVMIG